MQLRPEFVEAINDFLVQYKFYIHGFLGLTILFCFGVFIFFLTMFGAPNLFGMESNAGHKRAMQGMLIAGVSLIVLGSLELWYWIFLSTIIIGK